jgi:hypothetical protein
MKKNLIAAHPNEFFSALCGCKKQGSGKRVSRLLKSQKSKPVIDLMNPCTNKQTKK